MTLGVSGREPAVDGRDLELMRARVELLELVDGVRVGDFVEFAGGVTRRVSFVTPVEWLEGDDPVDSVQTSDGGSWYLGDAYVSFSGGLFGGVPRRVLELTGERRPGVCWFFHHDYMRAHNGVEVLVPWRVYRCALEAPR